MNEITNKTLAILIGIAIVISLAGLIMVNQSKPVSLTGRGSSGSGEARFSTLSEASVNVTKNIDWGSGRVDSSADSAKLYSNNASCVDGNWTLDETGDNARAIIIENDGTENISVDIKANTTAATFIGGALDGGPEYQYWVQEGEAGSCVGGIKNGSTYTEFTAADTDYRICDLLNIGTTENQLNTSIYMKVPADAPTGSRKSTITFTATKVS